MAAVQQSSQQLVQSLKQELEATKTQVAEKTAELRGLVDANLALKQELGKLQEAAKEAAEAEGKRKAECETLIAQIGKLNSQAAAEAEAAKGREANLTIALGAARETAEKVVPCIADAADGVSAAGVEWSLPERPAAVERAQRKRSGQLRDQPAGGAE